MFVSNENEKVTNQIEINNNFQNEKFNINSFNQDIVNFVSRFTMLNKDVKKEDRFQKAEKLIRDLLEMRIRSSPPVPALIDCGKRQSVEAISM